MKHDSAFHCEFSRRLKAKQGTERDEDFARRLGISRAHWVRVKLGTRGVTMALAQQAVARWPELEDIFISGIRREVRAGSATLAEITATAGSRSADDNGKAERSA